MRPARRLVTGLVKTQADAEDAVRRLLEHGYVRNDITVIMREESLRHIPDEWIFEDFGADHIRGEDTGERFATRVDWRPIRI